MPLRRLLTAHLVALSCATLVGTPASHAQQQPADSEAAAQQADSLDRLWADFVHYVRIARPALATEAAQGLVGQDAGSVLDAVEASQVSDPASLFDRARGMGESLPAVATELQKLLENARLDRSRDEQRIAANINRLNNGQRGFANGVARLKAAGQYAAPQLLAVLEDEAQGNMHPFVISAMNEIGQPMVAPLSTALPDLAPVPQSQVAGVLAEIGYPAAMAALREVVAAPDTNEASRRDAQAALGRLQQSNPRIPANLSAAELHLLLGKGYYATGNTPDNGRPRSQPIGFDPVADAGIIWVYSERVGLVGREVPASIYSDALARRHALAALRLNPELASALNLFLAADLRADNRLGEGEVDVARPDDLRDPEFFAMLAGPDRLRSVLALALADADTALALDAVDALARTASSTATDALVQALAFPDQRVRFRAAEALARALPQRAFANDFRVVSVLTEAIRPEGRRVAVVLSRDPEQLNRLSAAASELGYEPIRGASLAEVQPVLAEVAAVDLIAVAGNADDAAGTFENSARNAKLGGTPIVAYADAGDQIRLNTAYGSGGRFASVQGEVSAETLGPAAEGITARFAGEAPTPEVAERNALTALSLLARIATAQTVLDASLATPAVIAALDDPRVSVQEAAGVTLSRLPQSDAQTALAEAAVTREGEVQMSLLESLAESASRHGNLLSDTTATDRLLELVRTTEGELAVAAAAAHGALALPVSNAVELLTAAVE